MAVALYTKNIVNSIYKNIILCLSRFQFLKYEFLQLFFVLFDLKMNIFAISDHLYDKTSNL